MMPESTAGESQQKRADTLIGLSGIGEEGEFVVCKHKSNVMKDVNVVNVCEKE